MPGSVLVGFALCASKSTDHCIAAASAHIGGWPIALGFPAMQVKPLFPSRRTTLLPCVSVSTILAALATLAGPADIARAILTSVESPLFIDEL
jgi:hypothetical protein